MARSPFQGTYQPNVRPTVVMAPDALVYINGEVDIIGCGSCKKRFDFGKYITQLQVDLSLDSVPGSASITMSIPRHVVDDFFFDGVPLVTAMMEVEIFAKGFYLLEGLPQYYPIFWGLITEVSDSYSSGEHTVTIQCADILKWWEICRMNVNPAFTAPAGQAGTSIFGNVFFGTNPYDTIFTLANMAFGDVIVGTGSLVNLSKEASQPSTFSAVLGDIMLYWASRFSRIRSNLLLYGVNGVAVRGDSIAQAYETGRASPRTPYASTAVRVANGTTQKGGSTDATQLVFDPTDPGVTAFRTQFAQAGQINFWQSEYQTKLEIANACKEAIGFEFYMDVTGDIVFKPPFYNLDIISNKPVSWIQDIDTIDWNFSENESEVVTQISLQGSFGGNVDYGFSEEMVPSTSVTDYHLLRKYGWRPHTYNSEFMGDPLMMYYHGLDILDRLNSRRHQGTVTIPIRPELRIGYPIYIAAKDQVWYIKGISHNIAFGGRASTTLQLTARREKFKAPKGISSLKMTGDTSDAAFRKAQAAYVKLMAANDKNTSKAQRDKNAALSISSPQSPTKAKKDTGDQGPPNTKELARKTFELELGDAATIPPLNLDPNNAKTLEAYEPLILRHPKTGRIVGYPNVVMVYTRPFDNKLSAKAYGGIAGQAPPGKSPEIKTANKAKVENTQKKNLEKTLEAFTATDFVGQLLKHGQNKYQYGVTSSGSYVYAHDKSKVITQFALIPASNITVTKDTDEVNAKDSPLKGGTTMVRPVSDERGFEVIGHFRYGRGVALRDGSLILNENGGKNARTNPGIQFALSGDLFATLTAQSQGLTSVASAYANPADAIARMQPEDLQTAGILVPGGTDGQKKPQFDDTKENFVESAPLGSGIKTAPSVEAGQLSRALTLAEMSVREDATLPNDDKCACQMSRADLAFINIGYSVKTLNGAVPDTSELYGQAIVAMNSADSARKELQAQVKAAEKKSDALEKAIADLNKKLAGTGAATPNLQNLLSRQIAQLRDELGLANQSHSELLDQLAQAQQEFESLAADSQQQRGQPRGPESKFSNVRSKVEGYLFGLYQALDAPHQTYENALRGAAEEPSRSPPDLFKSPDPESLVAPPFGASNRSGLGDPVATALQGSSAAADLKNKWDSFGKSLQDKTKRTQLAQEIAALRAKLARLEKRKQDLIAEGTPTSYVAGNTDTIEKLDKDIAETRQELTQKEAELAQIT